jgi:hypothetical protein
MPAANANQACLLSRGDALHDDEEGTVAKGFSFAAASRTQDARSEDVDGSSERGSRGRFDFG